MICCFDFGGFGVGGLVGLLSLGGCVLFGLCVLVFLVGVWICCFLAVAVVINLDWFGWLCWFCFACRSFVWCWLGVMVVMLLCDLVR